MPIFFFLAASCNLLFWSCHRSSVTLDDRKLTSPLQELIKRRKPDRCRSCQYSNICPKKHAVISSSRADQALSYSTTDIRIMQVSESSACVRLWHALADLDIWRIRARLESNFRFATLCWAKQTLLPGREEDELCCSPMHHEWLRLLQLLLQLQLLLVSDISRLGGKYRVWIFPLGDSRGSTGKSTLDGEHLFVCTSSRDMGETVLTNRRVTCTRVPARFTMSVNKLVCFTVRARTA